MSTVEVHRQDWSVDNGQGQEVDMGKVLNGVIALTISAAMLNGGALGASAQDDEGSDDVKSPVTAGTADDGQSLLPRAGITIDAAIQAAQRAASGAVGEVDLEYADDRLVFNVDIGDRDVKVDADSGAVLSIDGDD
jgi:uncharacterized membrane protein YkoI